MDSVLSLFLSIGTPPQTGSASLIITLDDVADSDPRFVEPYTAEVEEDAEPPVFVVTVTAEDNDLEPGGPPFQFDLVTQELDDKFAWEANNSMYWSSCWFVLKYKLPLW